MNPFDFIGQMFGLGGPQQPPPTTPPFNPADPSGPPSVDPRQAYRPPQSGLPGPFGQGTSLIGTPLDFIFGPSERLVQQQRQHGFEDYTRRSGIALSDDENRARSAILSRAGEIRANNPGAGPDKLLPMLLADPVWHRESTRAGKDANKLITDIMGSMQPTPPINVTTARASP